MNTAAAATHNKPCLRTAQGQIVPLQSLAITGRLEDTLARVALTQTFRNVEAVNVEAVYTFPLPVQAVLLELEVTIADRRLLGRVAPRQQAEAQYEEALSEGHTTVMLEQVEPGLYTFNLGNLLAGESAQIHLHYALPMRWEQDELRLSLPTTLAPRYGDAARAGVQPHQQPQSDALVEYPYQLSLAIGGALSQAVLSSPTHRILSERGESGLVVRIADETSFADRDFVLNLKASGSAQSSLALAPNGEAHVAHAVFRIPERSAEQPICLKILVDCSGSMAGDSMDLAKALAMRALDRLGSKDRFSVTAFGSQHRHHADGRICDAGSGAALVKGREFVGGLDANLGGTEMLSALQAVFGPTQARREVEAADVLLITDGETWDRDAIVAAARASGHRIFVIGVGSSPSEILARGIAEATGGFASFIAPREQVEPVIERHLARMRLPRVLEARLKLPGTTLWQCPDKLEAATFAGDTLHVFAGLGGSQAAGGAHLDIRYADGSLVTVSANSSERQAAPADGDLSRIGAAQRLWWAGAGLVDSREQELTALAVKYQLMSSFTNYILVHERGETAATSLPQLRQVSQMLAAGWGGVGTLNACMSMAPMPVMASCLELAAPFDLPVDHRSAKSRRTALAGAAPAGPMPSLQAGSSDEVDLTVTDDSREMLMGGGQVPGRLIESLNGRFGLIRPDRQVCLSLAELGDVGVPADVVGGLRALVREGHDEEAVVLAFWKALLALPPVAKLFGRMHRRAILAAVKAHPAADPLVPMVAAALLDTDADQWCWVMVTAETLAPV